MALSTNNKGARPFGGDPNATGDLTAASQAASKPKRRSARGSDIAKQEKKDRREKRTQHSHKGDRRTQPPHKAEPKTSGQASRQAFLKYANDNAVVRWLYQLTTGPQRHLFFIVIGALIAVGVYMPVRDLYIATRTEQVLQEQKAIRDKYNESIAEDAKQWLSEEGVRDTARKELGMVMPGETPIKVEGLDEDGNPIVVQDEPAEEGSQPGDAKDGANAAEGASEGSAGTQSGEAADGDDGAGSSSADAQAGEDSGKLKGSDAADKSKSGAGAEKYDPREEPATSAEVEAAEKAVFENSPWWWKVLDVLFFFDGVNGMAVISTGE